MRINLQLFGGRGGGFGGGGGSSGGNINATTDSLVSARNEGKQRETDEALGVLRDIYDRYGVNVMDAQIATIKGHGKNTVLAYYDSNGNLAVNSNFFDAAKMNQVYDADVDSGWHPSRGNKTGLEATVAHEMGHRLTDVAGMNQGYGSWAVDRVANETVSAAAKSLGYKSVAEMRSKISGYGSKDNAEAVAEAFSDVYCNGTKAHRESIAIINQLNRHLRV